VDGGKTDVCTYISHGARECDDYILGRMASHLMLTRAQLDDLIDCTLGERAYVKLLREHGVIKA
jgi:hypothetical protein